jgi:hypothetical protein
MLSAEGLLSTALASLHDMNMYKHWREERRAACYKDETPFALHCFR